MIEMPIHQAYVQGREGGGRIKRQRGGGGDKRILISGKAPLLDGLAPSSALIIQDSLCILGPPESHLGTLRDPDSGFLGNVLAVMIRDPQVYEKVECKHEDKIKSFKL